MQPHKRGADRLTQLAEGLLLLARSDDRHDIVGRTDIEYATESNVIDLANRPKRILGKHVNRKVKTA